MKGIKSLLKNARDISMNGVKAEEEESWGKDGLLCPNESTDAIKERALSTMVRNLILNSVTKSGIDKLDLRREKFEHFRLEKRVFVQDGPSLIKILFDIVKPEAIVDDS